LGCHDKELSILFTDDGHMAELNHRYLGKSGPTNVLAFPMWDSHLSETSTPEVETPLLGDVVISVDTAIREADASGKTLEKTMDRLLIHGILHLIGYDHEVSDVEAERMEGEEKRLIGLIE